MFCIPHTCIQKGFVWINSAFSYKNPTNPHYHHCYRINENLFHGLNSTCLFFIVVWQTECPCVNFVKCLVSNLNDKRRSIVKANLDLYRLWLSSFSFCLMKATRPKICKKCVCFYKITTSLWRYSVNLMVFEKLRLPRWGLGVAPAIISLKRYMPVMYFNFIHDYSTL